MLSPAGRNIRALSAAASVALSIGLQAHPQPARASTTAATTWSETTGGVAHTWTNYRHASGQQGPTVPSQRTVQVSCRVKGLKVQDGDRWWYRIASKPWRNKYYASADAFYNNGRTSGSLRHTPFVDSRVRIC